MVRIHTGGAWLIVWAAAVWLLPSEAGANGLSAGLIYGVGVDNSIYSVDTTLESITFVEPSLSVGVKANGFATDRGRNQVLYFGSNGDLYYYDILLNTSGTVATAATFAITPDYPPEDATYYAGSYWYIAKGNTANNTLYQATLSYTGGIPSFSGTPVEYPLEVSGTWPGMMFGDIVVNGSTGMLYGSTTPGSGGLFFSLDMASLVAGTSNPVTVISHDNPIGLQLAFSEDYTVLYGQRYLFDALDPDNPALTSGQWYSVNTVSGSYSALAGFVTSPGMRDLAGIASVPEPAASLLAAVGVAVAVRWSRYRSAGSH